MTNFLLRLEAKYSVLSAEGKKEPKDTMHWSFDGSHEGAVTVKRGGKEVATIKFWKNSSYPSYLNVSYVGVEKEFRRGGIAVKALQFLKKKAKTEGFKYIEGEITWTGAFDMMVKVFGKPDSIFDAIRDHTEKELRNKLPKETPENEKGMIDDADYLNVQWKL